MKNAQKKQIETMRKQGLGYKAIAKNTKLSRDSVRHYCRDHGLSGYGKALAASMGGKNVYEES